MNLDMLQETASGLAVYLDNSELLSCHLDFRVVLSIASGEQRAERSVNRTPGDHSKITTVTVGTRTVSNAVLSVIF